MTRSNNRQLYFGLSILIVLVLILFLLLLNARMYPRWEGVSSDGKWKVVYPISNDPHADNEGTAYWQGSKKKKNHIYLTFQQLRVNGKYYAGAKQETNSKKEAVITDSDNTSLAEFVTESDFSHKKVVQYLYWKKDNGPLHKEKILLKKKTLFGLVTLK
ncbi:DUF4944 domain-containing protein [Camelliibacillus cellulosilyticus]|uniref:DUF4944 domain-containing protein n=1 Tax=Camelliibacillus cellulosilyticus TaxID=2174486 RepID=A0ABV9GHM1_9BACL